MYDSSVIGLLVQCNVCLFLWGEVEEDYILNNELLHKVREQKIAVGFFRLLTLFLRTPLHVLHQTTLPTLHFFFSWPDFCNSIFVNRVFELKNPHLRALLRRRRDYFNFLFSSKQRRSCFWTYDGTVLLRPRRIPVNSVFWPGNTFSWNQKWS